MATALRSFRKVQIGKESTKGTLVPATVVLVGEGRLAEQQEFYRSNYPRGQRATVGGAGTIVRKGSVLTWETELTAEDILWPLSTGIKGNVSPTNTNSEYAWAFAPQITTGVPTLDAATVEFIEADGVTNHIASEAGYAMTRKFGVSFATGEIARLSWEMFARARQTSTPTNALTPYTSREPLASDLCKVYLDTSYAGIGGTQLTTIVRSGEFECVCGVEPDYTVDGRSDKDYSKHRVESLSATLNLVLEMDATGAARYADFRDNDVVFIRLKFEGSTVVANARSVTIDGAYRFVGEPGISEDGEQVLVTLNLEAVYDSTGTVILDFDVVNGLATL